MLGPAAHRLKSARRGTPRQRRPADVARSEQSCRSVRNACRGGWLAIASSKESVVSLDRNTVNKLHDGTYAAWVEFRHRQPQSADEGTLRFDRAMYREQVDCVERRDRWLSLTQFLGEQQVRSLNS